MPYVPIVPEGHHLGTSHQVSGAVTGHLFEDGTNALKGHAAWQWVEDTISAHASYDSPNNGNDVSAEDRESLRQILIFAVVAALVAAEAAKPHASKLWTATILPRLTAAWKRITLARKKSKAVIIPTAVEDIATSLPASLAVRREDWTRLYLATLEAAEFKQKRELTSPRSNGVNEENFDRSLKFLHPESKRVAVFVREILQANPDQPGRNFAMRILRELEA